MEFKSLLFSYIIGFAILLFIVFFQYKKEKISLNKSLIAIIVYITFAIPLFLIRINIHSTYGKVVYSTVLFLITTAILWYMALKNKTATPKQLIKGMLIGFGIGTLLLLLLIIGVVIFVLITSK